MGEKETKFTVGEKTRVSLGAVWALLGAAFVGAACYWGLKMDFEEVKTAVKQLHGECMTVPRFQGWSDDLRDANPAIRVPRVPAIERGGSMPDEKHSGN